MLRGIKRSLSCDVEQEAGMFSREDFQAIIKKKLNWKLQQHFPNIKVINNGGKMIYVGPRQKIEDGMEWIKMSLEGGQQLPRLRDIKREDSKSQEIITVVVYDPHSNQTEYSNQKYAFTKQKKEDEGNQLEEADNILRMEVERLKSEVAAKECDIEEYKKKVDELNKELTEAKQMKTLENIKRETEEYDPRHKAVEEKYLQLCEDHQVLVDKYLMQEVMMRDKDKHIIDLMIKMKKMEEATKKEKCSGKAEYFEAA